MKINKVLIAIFMFWVCFTILMVGEVYAADGDPTQFGNSTTTTAWIGGTNGIGNFTGWIKSSSQINATTFYQGSNSVCDDSDNCAYISDSEEGNLNVNSSDYWDNLNTESDLTPSNFLTAGNYISYTGSTLNVANQDILDASTINASQVQNFDIAGPSSYFYANIINMSDESVTYVDGSSLFLKNDGDTATSNYTFDGNITATAFFGDGSQLTGISTTTAWNESAGNVYLATTSNNVGIGTTNPTRKLQVESTSQAIASFKSSTVNPAGITVSNSETVDDFEIGFLTDGNDLLLYSNGTRMTIDSTTGNVGIGTTSPDNNLDVSSASNTIVKIQDSSGGNPSLSLRVDDGASSEAQIYTNSGTNELNIYTSGNPGQLVLANSGNVTFNTGNVGIGTTSPSEKLEVNGVSCITSTDNTNSMRCDFGSRLALASVYLFNVSFSTSDVRSQLSTWISINDNNNAETNFITSGCDSGSPSVGYTITENGASTAYNLEWITGTDWCALYFNETGVTRSQITGMVNIGYGELESSYWS